jgi:hypothetical protein
LPWQDAFALPFFFFALIGMIIITVGNVLFYTKEGGVWKELSNRTTILNRITGNFPVIRGEMPRPIFSKRIGIIIGISLTIGAFFGTMASILIKISFLRGFFIAASLSALISGLVFIIFSIIFLGKNDS